MQPYQPPSCKLSLLNLWLDQESFKIDRPINLTTLNSATDQIQMIERMRIGQNTTANTPCLASAYSFNFLETSKAAKATTQLLNYYSTTHLLNYSTTQLCVLTSESLLVPFSSARRPSKPTSILVATSMSLTERPYRYTASKEKESNTCQAACHGINIRRDKRQW